MERLVITRSRKGPHERVTPAGRRVRVSQKSVLGKNGLYIFFLISEDNQQRDLTLFLRSEERRKGGRERAGDGVGGGVDVGSKCTT